MQGGCRGGVAEASIGGSFGPKRTKFSRTVKIPGANDRENRMVSSEWCFATRSVLWITFPLIFPTTWGSPTYFKTKTLRFLALPSILPTGQAPVPHKYHAHAPRLGILGKKPPHVTSIHHYQVTVTGGNLFHGHTAFEDLVGLCYTDSAFNMSKYRNSIGKDLGLSIRQPNACKQATEKLPLPIMFTTPNETCQASRTPLLHFCYTSPANKTPPTPCHHSSQ